MSLRKTRTLVFDVAESFEDTSVTKAQLGTISRVPLVMMCSFTWVEMRPHGGLQKNYSRIQGTRFYTSPQKTHPTSAMTA